MKAIYNPRFAEKTRTWEKAKVLDEHKDWVRDVAFADSLGVSLTFASCSQAYCHKIYF